MLVGATQLGQAGPNLEAVATARAAAVEVFNVIDRKPTIDVSSEEGEKPSDVNGDIEFRDIHFCYPSRQDVKVISLCHFWFELCFGGFVVTFVFCSVLSRC